MKKIILTLIPLLCSILAAAQPPQGERPQRSREEIQTLMEQRNQQRNAELRSALSLSDTAAHKVDSINAKYDRLLLELAPDGENRREARPNVRQMRPEGRPGGRPNDRQARPDDERLKKLQNLQKSREIEVKEYLSEEQKAEYDKWLKESQRRESTSNRRREQ
jgi:exoribonuclease R